MARRATVTDVLTKLSIAIMYYNQCTRIPLVVKCDIRDTTLLVRLDFRKKHANILDDASYNCRRGDRKRLTERDVTDRDRERVEIKNKHDTRRRFRESKFSEKR